MSNFLLDTTTISDYLKRDEQVISKILSTKPNRIFISAISKYEIAYGLRKKPSLIPKYGRQLTEFYRLTNDLVFTEEIATVAATIAHELKVKGQPIGVPDVLIAATAKYENLTLVSSNIKHFSKVQELKIIDWKM